MLENVGRSPIAEIVGTAMSGDAYHITPPAPETRKAAFRVMKMPVRDAKIQPTDIGYVNAHGTSTPIGDTLEAMPSATSSAITSSQSVQPNP